MYKDFNDIYDEISDPEFLGVKTDAGIEDTERIYEDEFFESPGAFEKKARQYFDQVRKYRYLRERYYTKRAKNKTVKTARYDGVRSGTRTTDTITRNAVELETLREKCAEIRDEILRLMVLLISEIGKAPDARLRIILTQRIIDLKEWRDISFDLYGTSENSDRVRKAYKRYLEAHYG